MKTIFCMFILFLAFSCGKDKQKPNHSSYSNEFNFAKEGIYKGFFIPINSSMIGLASGNIRIKLLNDEFDVKLVMLDVPAIKHSQFVYQGKRCPTFADDVNQDGYIDAKEGEIVYGKALIPLDGDLTQQLEENRDFPFASRLGSYVYEQLTSWSKLLDDLKQEDLNPKDHIVKSKNGMDLNDRVIVVHGIDNSLFLPNTVEGLQPNDVRATLPIACAKLSYIQKMEIE